MKNTTLLTLGFIAMLYEVESPSQNLHEGTNIFASPPPLPAVSVDTNSVTQTNCPPRTNFDQSMTLDWPSYSNPAQQYLAEMQCGHPLPDYTKLPTMNAEVQASYDLSSEKNWFVAYSFGTNRPPQLVIHYTPDSVPQTVYYRWRLCP